jgi:hypothetical protein
MTEPLPRGIDRLVHRGNARPLLANLRRLKNKRTGAPTDPMTETGLRERIERFENAAKDAENFALAASDTYGAIARELKAATESFGELQRIIDTEQ